MLSSYATRRLLVRCSARTYSTSPRPPVKIYLHDADVGPIAQFEHGVSIMQIRDYFNVRGGGLKLKGDAENVILKDKPTGFDGGEYILFGYQGNNPSVHLHHQQQQQQLQLQFLHHQLMQYQQHYPQAQQQAIPQQQQQQQQQQHHQQQKQKPNYTTNITPTNEPSNIVFDSMPQQHHHHHVPTTQQKSNPAKPSLAHDLGIDSAELEMFPWLVDENNTKPF